MNVVVLRGRLGRAVEQRELPNGSVVLNYELSVARAEGPVESVPVVWADPPANAAAALDPEPRTELVVLGRVRRRFFKAGGATQSRTEVVAEQVTPARQAKRVRDLLGTAEALLGGG